MEVGDRIIIIRDLWNKNLRNKHGTIIYVGRDLYSIRFDKNIGGHSCSHRCTYGYGWNVEKENVVLEKVSIKGLLLKRSEDSS